MFTSEREAREAEHEARKQRLSLAHLLKADKSKATTAKEVMAVRRLVAAANERSVTFHLLISDHEAQRLFDVGALWFARPGEP